MGYSFPGKIMPHPMIGQAAGPIILGFSLEGTLKKYSISKDAFQHPIFCVFVPSVVRVRLNGRASAF